MDSNLDQVLSGEVAEPVQPEQTQQAEQVEQVEQETPEQTTTGEEPATPAEPQKDDPLEKHRKGLEQAAAAERKRRQEAEQRASQFERELAELRQQHQPRAQAQASQEDPKPQRAQFETEDQWLDARDEWRDRQQARAWQEQQQERAQQTMRQKTESVFAEAMKLPGFDMQAFVRLPVPDAVADAILDSEVAPQLVHYLTTNPEEAYRIAGLSSTRQVKELTRIEDKLTASSTEKEEVPQQREKPRLPETLTTARNAKGQFEKPYDGPTPLNSILE